MTTSTTVMSSADRSKFECLFMRLERLLFSIAYGILQNVTLAEDAVSETALRAVKYFDRFKDADDVKARAYLCAICKSVSYNMLKSVNRTTPNSDIVTLNPDQNDFSNPESTYVENEELLWQ